MDVIVDTSILLRDTQLESSLSTILFDYLHRTGGHFFLSEVTLREALGRQRREIKDLREGLSGKAGPLEKWLFKARAHVPVDIDLDEEAEAYEALLRNPRPGIETKVDRLRGADLRPAIERLVERKRPASP